MARRFGARRTGSGARAFGHVSREFTARRTAGSCPLCAATFREGAPAVFLKAYVPTGSIRPTRLLDGSEQETFRRLFREAQAEGLRRGILPRRGRFQAPASLAEVEMSPAWLFDHMVHRACLPSWAPSPGSDVIARPGTRTEGAMHGTARGVEAAAPAPAPEARPAPSYATPDPAVLRGVVSDMARMEAEAVERVAAAQRAAEATRQRQEQAAGWMPSMAASYQDEREASVRTRQERAQAIAERNRVLSPALNRPAPTAPARATSDEGARFAGLELGDETPVGPGGRELEDEGGRFAGLELE